MRVAYTRLPKRTPLPGGFFGPETIEDSIKMKSYFLAALLPLSLSFLACAAPTDGDDAVTSESALTTPTEVESVVDFMSSGEFGCRAEEEGVFHGREADISISVRLPRRSGRFFSADASFKVVGGPRGNTTFFSQQQGANFSSASASAGTLSVEFAFGQVQCEFRQAFTDVNGNPKTRVFSGPLVRFSKDCFDESFYRQSQPDIVANIFPLGAGFLSGRMHYEEFGRRDGRPGCASTNP